MRVEDQLAAASRAVEDQLAAARAVEDQLAAASRAVADPSPAPMPMPKFAAGQSVHQWWAPWMPGVLGGAYQL
jgi:hypothetical protein